MHCCHLSEGGLALKYVLQSLSGVDLTKKPKTFALRQQVIPIASILMYSEVILMYSNLLAHLSPQRPWRLRQVKNDVNMSCVTKNIVWGIHSCNFPQAASEICDSI